MGEFFSPGFSDSPDTQEVSRRTGSGGTQRGRSLCRVFRWTSPSVDHALRISEPRLPATGNSSDLGRLDEILTVTAPGRRTGSLIPSPT